MMFGSVYSQCLGDLNGDGIKDILDIVNLVNDILDGDDVCEECGLTYEEMEAREEEINNERSN